MLTYVMAMLAVPIVTCLMVFLAQSERFNGWLQKRLDRIFFKDYYEENKDKDNDVYGRGPSDL